MLSLPPKRHKVTCYVISGSSIQLGVAKTLAWMMGSVVQRMVIRLVDVKDKDGLLVRLRITFYDLFEVLDDAVSRPKFKNLASRPDVDESLRFFLKKSFVAGDLYHQGPLWRPLFLIQVCIWGMVSELLTEPKPLLFMVKRPWFDILERYGERRGLRILGVKYIGNWRSLVRNQMPKPILDLIRVIYHGYTRRLWSSGSPGPSSVGWGGNRFSVACSVLANNVFFPLKNKLNSKANTVSSREDTEDVAKTGFQQLNGDSPRLAVEYYGNLNLSQPERHSELFFWQQSGLKGEDILVTFSDSRAPLDGPKLSELSAHGMSGIPLQATANDVLDVKTFVQRPAQSSAKPTVALKTGDDSESKWLRDTSIKYQASRSFWTMFFESYNIKLYTGWYKYDAAHFAITDAIRSIGGISTIYQRAYECHPSPQMMINADIVFGFSQNVATVEHQSRSQIKYHVTTGYLGDHRFKLLRKDATNIRDRLKVNGAQYVISYSDENSSGNTMWATDDRFTQANYAFLLEKVMQEPWLGLVIKPKIPNTLRSRLGPVRDLLLQAENTGRCFVHDEGALIGARPPCEAALAADIAIHGHLCAATAGVESALAGVPTLLIDREGWGVSPLYDLGVGQVVFTDWQSLWEKCVEHWFHGPSPVQLGDWGSFLADLDPFRDGQAAQRMGDYLNWIMEGYKDGLPRETILENTAQRYSEIWGKDKVTQIGTN